MSTDTPVPEGSLAADSTVDAREARFYRNLADRWWDERGPFWPLHRLNELRAAYLGKRLSALFDTKHPSSPLRGLDVVDIGCGGGILSESIAGLGAKVTGIDVVEKNIHVADLHANAQGLEIDYRLITASELGSSGVDYDVVLNMEVVEHVADLDAFLDDCCKLLRPGGVMAVATINRTWLAYLFAILGAEYVLGWLPKGTHRWRNFRTPREIESRLSRHGLHLIEKRGVRVNPFTRVFSLTRAASVNYMLLFIKNPT